MARKRDGEPEAGSNRPRPLNSISSRHRNTFDAVFADPVRANIGWTDIEALIVALGAERYERAGSRVAFRLGGTVGLFHRPHPEKEACRGAVKSVRKFLLNAGVRP